MSGGTFTDSLDVNIGDATKASDYDSLADNTEYNRETLAVEHDAPVSGGTGVHKSISFLDSTDVIALKAGSASLPSLTAEGDLNTGIFYPAADTWAVATAGSERVRVDSSGNVGIGTTPSYTLDVSKSNNSNYIANVDQVGTATNSHVLRLEYSGATIDNNSGVFLGCFDTTASRMFIYSDGDLANHDGTYGTISDVKFKQDIEDMRSYWDDFKSLQYRKFRHKSDVEADADAPYRLGLIAQEVETVFPALVPESPDADIREEVAIVDENGDAVLDDEGNLTFETVTTPSGTTHKWIKSSIIEGPIMASVVQELMQRVEALEAA